VIKFIKDHFIQLLQLPPRLGDMLVLDLEDNVILLD
jgi:hypothetical protein